MISGISTNNITHFTNFKTKAGILERTLLYNYITIIENMIDQWTLETYYENMQWIISFCSHHGTSTKETKVTILFARWTVTPCGRYINNNWEYDRSMNIRDILWEHAMNYFILLSPYVGNAVAMPSLLIRDSYVFNSANASSGVRVTCAPVRRDTGLRDPVCLISRWAHRTCSDIFVYLGDARLSLIWAQLTKWKWETSTEGEVVPNRLWLNRYSIYLVELI